MEKRFFTKSPDKQCHNAASEKRKKTSSRVSEKSKNEKTQSHEQRIASIKAPAETTADRRSFLRRRPIVKNENEILHH